ncbi:Putative MYB DNA-binding domain superfamily protein [Zea mays]|uniref:Putative MYB DNA-binding domain superfamily protein n=1 Tax=Zea mays TaxID=4577 RepID=A0A1D6JF30_MAIZE|nr:Putative MYB DNA-binding domain superfamily protein [Zea mays]
MASARKVRNANKRYAKINEDWQDKDTPSVPKSKVRKKKLSDMLGSQWSKDELERFYGAYRKYGKDWRKVAGTIRDRTSDMVKALYNMNKAYLSLPEGTATAAGLIAMMTDHYNILDGSNSDRESSDSPKASRRLQKRGRAKLQSVSKTSDTHFTDLLQPQPASSSYGCLSLLKKKRSGDLFVGNRPRAVGKRTPRVPVASMYHRDDRGAPNRQAKPDANDGDDEGLPTDLARPLAVGQRVIACHPRTRELHDGNVLTVDHNQCRVQFDRPELGVELVKDIDCMPLHPLENFPESLRHQSAINGYYSHLSEAKYEDQMKELASGGAARSTSNLNGTDATFYTPSGHPMSTLMKQAKANTAVNEVAVATQQSMYNQPCTLSQIQEREADIRALGELSRALDKKEALLVELRHMNEEVSGKQKDGEIIKDLEHFRKQYAMVLVQLRDSNDQVAAALLSLRQRNTYHGNSGQSKSMENGIALAGAPDPYNLFSYINPESGSQVIEVIETSKSRAKMMVDVAIQAMCKVSEGENAFSKIGEALDHLNSRGTGSGSSILGIRRIPPDSGQSNASYHDDCTAAPAANSSSRLPNGCDSEAQFPKELISSCVAMMLMIKNCTEKQYHPAEVAHILDSALSSVQPCSSQNIPIFREIEMCMGIIKNQMLALIPTPSG